MKRIGLIVAGVFFILIGIIGWLLPILPGWPFIFFGLSFIAPAFAARLKRRILRKFSKKEIVFLDNWKKQKINAGFTTRHFPLVLHKTDDLLDKANQDLFVGAIHELPLQKNTKIFSDKFIFLDQVHGDHIEIFDDPKVLSQDRFIQLRETDGVLTNLSDVTLLVLTADCLPLFISAGKGEKQWIGLVHAGWRGTEKKIALKAFEAIRQRSGCRASDIQVMFGPRIGKDHYEVGEDFAGRFSESVHRKNGKLYFDLTGENKRQLLQAGASRDKILDLELCTVSENEDFYSFRKEKDAAGRMISFINKF